MILIVAPAHSLASDTSERSPAGAGASPAPPGKPSKVLTGGAQHAQPLKSSVKLIPQNSVPGKQRAGPWHGQPQYPVRRLIFIPNAPVSAFRRERHQTVRLRELPPPPVPAEIVQKELPVSKPIASTGTYDGITTWAPGYDSTFVSHFQPNPLEAPVHGILRSTQMQPTRSVLPSYRSTPGLLSELFLPRQKQNITWDEWYQRVCRTVYDQWLLDDTGPGKACIHVTVWSTRDIECKVVDFTPAPGTMRNGVGETAFREAALRAVRSLDRCQVLEFPAQFRRSIIDFDLDISRAVDGPFGCQVVVGHGSGTSKPTIR